MVDYISKFEAEEIDELLQKAKECGSSGGIIDVTELPTENIDENAVYRVTENIQVEKNEIYIGAGESAVTISQYLASLGVPTIPNIYAVDELPSDMKVSDVQTFSELHVYILKSDGIAYLNVPAYGGVITVGLFGFQATGYDKGFTENIYAETEVGVYTTLEAYGTIVRWFVRENSEWKEITAYVNLLSPNGFEYLHPISGNLTTRVFSGYDVISKKCTEMNEEWFLNRNGEHHNSIYAYTFYSSAFETIKIPDFIKFIYGNAFQHSDYLKNVTFEGKPNSIYSTIFLNCDNLTTINVPWSEGEVSGAPWGATNATINYNYTGE